jgi:hypothetical protein
MMSDYCTQRATSCTWASRWYWPNGRLHPLAATFLREQGYRFGGVAFGSEVWQAPFGARDGAGSYAWWSLCDNGGEINVELVNDHGSMVSVAVPNLPNTPMTLAVRIYWALRGVPIDYDDFSMEELSDVYAGRAAAEVRA